MTIIKTTAGVDEVGRGPLAGDVVTAAVILDPNNPIDGLMDSKKLSEKKRTYLAQQIKEKALAWHIAKATVDEIDQLNILQASLLAMKRAVEGLSIRPDHVLIDGNRCPNMDYSMQAIIKGDQTEPAIAAASILAKVSRDQEMCELDTLYPEYGFAKHKGYPTKQHREAMMQHGICPLHRRSYAPVRQFLSLKKNQ